MHVVIHHHISDAVKWDRSVKHIMSLIDQHRLPDGFKALQFLPSADGRNAVCLWATDSPTALRKFMDRETGGSRNEYFEVKDEAAIGLPGGEVLAKAA